MASFFDAIGDKAKSAFADVEDEAKKALEKISSEVQEIGNSEIAQKILGELNELHKKLDAQAKQWSDEKIAMIKAFEKEKREMLVAQLAKKLSAAVATLLNIMVVKIKDALTADPYMPQIVKNTIRMVIDAIWPDVSEDIRENMLKIALPTEHPIDHGEPGCWAKNNCCCCCGDVLPPTPLPPTDEDDHCCCCESCCCRLDCETPCFGPIAYLLYLQFPYDMSIWRQIRKPMWWILTIISAIPKYGVSTGYYILLFFITDWDDEFQLLSFIRSFKALQFISVGVISALIGGGQLAVCTQPFPNECFSYSPREQVSNIVLFVLQVIITWIAFLLLPKAQNKGGFRYQLSKLKEDKLRTEARDARSTILESMATETVESAFFEENTDGAPQRGRLLGLLVYDTVVFLLCAGLVIWAAFGNLLDSSARVQNYSAEDPFVNTGVNWKFQMILYWIKCVYGLSSFPFMLLQIPGISALFSHAKPTAYNPYGNTVPLLGEEQEVVPWRRCKTPEEVQREKEFKEQQEVKRQQRLSQMEEEEDLKRTKRTGGESLSSPKLKSSGTNNTNNQNVPSSSSSPSASTNPFSAAFSSAFGGGGGVAPMKVNLVLYHSLSNENDHTVVALDNVLPRDNEESLRRKVLSANPNFDRNSGGQIYLAFNGNYLENVSSENGRTMTLKDYGIQNDSMIQVMKHADVEEKHGTASTIHMPENNQQQQQPSAFPSSQPQW